MAKEICRICLEKGSMTSVFHLQDKLMISTKIMSLAKVNIYPGDGLPNTICSKCISRLNNCIEFINLCKTSDLKLREAIISTNNESFNTTSSDNCDVLDEKPEFQLKEGSTRFLGNNEIVLDQNIDKSNCEDESNAHKPMKMNDKKVEKQQCFTCGKVMSSRFRLKTHLRTHTGERPFSCPHCSKNFSLAQNLKVHLRTHTGEKPLLCTICGESFAQTAGLAAHKRKHTGQTPYRCVLCPRSFRTIGHLQYHIRRHTGEKNFVCETCNRAFITRSDLKQHILSHTGDKPHVCCVCGLRLTRASHLKRHIKHMHNGINTFKCSECTLSFALKSEFEKHKKKHKNNDEFCDKIRYCAIENSTK